MRSEDGGTTTVRIAVAGMHCTSCGMLIDETLEELPGVSRASTDLRTETTTVDYDPARADLAAITAEIVELGYTATPRPDR